MENEQHASSPPQSADIKIVAEKSPTNDKEGEKGPANDKEGEKGPANDKEGEKGPADDKEGEKGPANDKGGEKGPANGVEGEKGPAIDEEGKKNLGKEEEAEKGLVKDEPHPGPSRSTALGKSPRGKQDGLKAEDRQRLARQRREERAKTLVYVMTNLRRTSLSTLF
ncbi:cylicin-2-like [Rhincodon typus]|uniref:cylicin-2-like n=1 Tax=Rhincodon typus TaxID=259920 RepID=UPI00202FAFAC|nr:cylicin-2-like [Rhincodon typus]